MSRASALLITSKKEVLHSRTLKTPMGAVIHAQTPLKHILSGYLMADLILQDFSDLSIQNLVQVLSNEKTKMFGEQQFYENRGEDNWLGSKPFAGSMLRSEKPGGRNART